LSNLLNNYQEITASLSEDITLVCVTKYVGIAETQELIQAGAQNIGENRIQVAREKIDSIPDNVKWQMIGPLQKNKAKYAVKMFDMIQSVDSLSLATELNKQAEKISKIQKILLQVNIGEESQKYGFLSSEVAKAITNVDSLKNIKIKGLMAIPPFNEDTENSRPYFQQMKSLFDHINTNILPLTYLSMGMSADYQVAIEEGSNMVRIGSLLFK